MPRFHTNPTVRVEDEFWRSVNMSEAKLRAWLETDESRSVGFVREGATESVGHQSGRHILRLMAQRDRGEQPSPADEAHMRKVVGYVKRHLAQRPQGDVRHTPWRYSLMNWGHDPLKEKRR